MRHWSVLPGLVGLVSLLHCAEYTAGEDSSAGSSGGLNGDTSSGRAPDGDGGAEPPGTGSSGVPSGSSSGTTPPGTGSSGEPGVPQYELTADERFMLDSINATRAAAPGASPPLNPVAWDYQIGATLRGWVATCSQSNLPNFGGTTTAVYGSLGDRVSTQELMQHMNDAGAYYNRAQNVCSSPYSCQPYTNQVQRGVSRVACAQGPTCPAPVPGGGPNEAWRSYGCVFAPLADPAARPY